MYFLGIGSGYKSETFAIQLALVSAVVAAVLWVTQTPQKLFASLFDVADESTALCFFWSLFAVLWVVIQRKAAAGSRAPSCPLFTARGESEFAQPVTALVTGANSGIGYYTALDLALRGVRVVITCRTPELTAATAANLRRDANARLAAGVLSMAWSSSFLRGFASKPINYTRHEVDIVDGFWMVSDDFNSVRACAQRFLKTGWPLHILINNAGAMTKALELSPNTMLEFHTAINFFGPLLLTTWLADRIRDSDGYVVNVASEAHRMPSEITRSSMFSSRGNVEIKTASDLLAALKQLNEHPYLKGPLGSPSPAHAFARYGASKLCNVYTAHYVVNRLGVRSCSLHPGCVATNFSKPLLKSLNGVVMGALTFLFKTAEEGAQTTVTCVLRWNKDDGQLKAAKAGLVCAPYFVECRDQTESMLRPMGKDVAGGLEVVDWALGLLVDYLPPGFAKRESKKEK